MRPDSTQQRQRQRRTGPLVLVLPFLFLVLGALHMLRQRPLQRLAPPPEVEDPEETIAGLSAEVLGADGARLEVWLAPLHADPARQRMDAQALRQRLGLPPGEPWRLTLSHQGPESKPAAAPRPHGAPGEHGPARGEPLAALESAPVLGAPAVVDASGEALSVAARPHASLLEPCDPLRTLLLPPPGALRSGQTAEWILWGRAPAGAARLEGLLPDPGTPEGVAFLESTGLKGPIELRPRPVRRSALRLPLAQLERPSDPGGKSLPPAASQGARGQRPIPPAADAAKNQ